MSEQANWLFIGRQLYQAGRLDEAAELYQEVVREDPGQAEAWCFLGLVSRARGRLDEAAGHYRRALEISPDFVEALNNLGNVCVFQGKLEEAEGLFRRALRLRPDHAEAHNNLGATLRNLGKLAEAVAGYREALRWRPNYPEAHNNLGDALSSLGRGSEAMPCFQQALRLKPNFPEAHNNLGVALGRLGKHDEAVAQYRQALRLRPNYVEAYSNLGNALAAQRKRDEAVKALQEAIRIQPDYEPAHYNLGIVYADSDRLEEAIACYQEAIRLRPAYGEALSNRGHAYRALGNMAEAMASYQQLIDLKPNDPEAHMARAMAWLLLGDYEQGWPEYEWRWQCKEFVRPDLGKPVWDGAALDGRTILLHAEQGLGDTIQYIRYAKLVKARGGRVVFHCPMALLKLLADCPGIDELAPQGSPPPAFDVHAPLLSLPAMLHTTLATVPAEAPYLQARPDLIDHWRRELASGPELKVGIAWQGNPSYRADRYRSVPLAAFAPLAQVPGVRLVSLQKGHGVEQIKQVPFEVIDLSQRLDEAGPFLDTAAVMKTLDVVIACDTVIAHLAGALGVPLWAVLSPMSHFCWLVDRDDSPWYPSARLFRQRRIGAWTEVFAALAQALRDTIDKPKTNKRKGKPKA